MISRYSEISADLLQLKVWVVDNFQLLPHQILAQYSGSHKCINKIFFWRITSKNERNQTIFKEEDKKGLG